MNIIICLLTAFIDVFLAELNANAQEKLKLQTNDYVIDTYNGLQLGSMRVVTMGGAFIAIAEKSQGIEKNPAAVAQRTWNSQHLFDYDAGYAYLKPGLFIGEDMDYDNDGDHSFDYKNFVAGTVFGSLKAGRAGGGGTTKFQRYVLNTNHGPRASIWQGTIDTAFGYNFRKNFLILGAGLRFSFLSISIEGTKGNALSYLYGGAIGGLLFRFKKVPLRLGIATHIPARLHHKWVRGVKNCPSDDGQSLKKVLMGPSCESEGLVIPDGISHPWSIRFGFAWFIGRLKWNEEWNMSKREFEYSNLVPMTDGTYRWSPWQSIYTMERSDIDRKYVIVAFDFEVVGGVKKGVGMEGFLKQEFKKSTESPTVSIHGGIESEVWANRLTVRLGGYAEPSRFKRKGYRGHGTFGFDLNLFSICWGSSKKSIRGSAGFDAAPGYFNAGFSIGFWN